MNRHVSRREALAGIGLGALSAGCLGRTRNIAGRNRPSQLTLQIDTAPADRDPNAIRIARHLAENLNAVGVDARINTLSRTDLWRKVLINQGFDVYVGQFLESEPFDPDAMYAFTHSRFVAEAGRRNPFGFTDINGVDDQLERQRRVEGRERRDAVAELQRSLCELQPFTVVAFPDPLSAVREDRFEGWTNRQPLSPGALLRLDRAETTDGTADDGDAGTAENATAEEETADEETADGDAVLRLVTTDDQITENWNPIAAEYRRDGTFTSLLYDQLALVDRGEVIPWLASGWERVDEETVVVDLRDARWHDGEPVTAGDVAFTYEFLRDTSMGSLDTEVPTPRFRGRSSVVRSATVVGDGRVELAIDDVNDAVAVRALQVPILPEHVWSERTDVATIAGFEFDVETTEAVVSNNGDPVGSGPIRFAEATAEESVVFDRNPDHFLARADSTRDEADPAAGVPERFRGKPAFERLRIEVSPSDIAAVAAVGDGLADATVSNLGPDAVPRIGRDADTRLVTGRSGGFYHVGYNARRAPLSNPRFRAVIASLIDKETLIDEAFDGYARPAASPLAASSEWVPTDLSWDDRETDPVYPFVGESGSIDTDEAKELFRDAGYRFDEGGRLLSRGE
ncbi:ABC transporter substrate-binding protein [Halorubrum sp. Ib24]|uniref:ABC transporter substrate-binding protein n=1 Tax=Halorubrum sp. Ib24 TaxID=1383850 RepID=UPI000B990FAA|nr:ABC transporter substrate-binding protein [Halorubrum sp. Ib24]OYR40087.1 ABC transporter substrate-binding protein [Halorubrum sp. Ib24]